MSNNNYETTNALLKISIVLKTVIFAISLFISYSINRDMKTAILISIAIWIFMFIGQVIGFFQGGVMFAESEKKDSIH